MTTDINKDCLKKISQSGDVKLELGCGNRKRHKDAIGIDLRKLPDVDIVGDALTTLKKINESSISAVYAYYFFEHLDNIDAYMVELNRILKPNALLEVVTPHFSNPYYYSDLTHKTPFGLYSFAYFCKNTIFRRTVPIYNQKVSFELLEVDLIFKSAPPFYLRWGLKKVVQSIFNLNRYMQELYEENFCYLAPCYEVRYVLLKK